MDRLISDCEFGISQFILHRAAWLVPVSRPPIADGAVLVHGGLIAAAGSYKEIAAQSPAHAERVDHGSAALMPALVNAHTHLELSLLQGKIELPQESFASWLREVLLRRQAFAPEMLKDGFKEGENLLAAGGTALCGDITNGACLRVEEGHSCLSRHAFLEVLGFDRYDLKSALDPALYSFFLAEDKNLSVSLAAHACYSTSAELIRDAKEWCRKRERIFSIHVAEHEDEIRFLQDGSGYCREILESLGRWVPKWTAPRMSPVRYLDSLGVLDERTILVHAVHMSESDWEIVAKRKCPVCFCLRSNHNLNAGRANIESAEKLGIVTAFGTDSLASNTDLNLFSEAVLALKEYPVLTPERVLSMMTIGGAGALRQESLYGSIEPGKRSALLAVSLPDFPAKHQLIETIIYQGEKGACRWANYPK